MQDTYRCRCKLQVGCERVEGATVPAPARMSSGAAGADLYASKAVTIQPMGRELVPTGYRLAIPRGYEGQIRPRSGLALNRGITVLNSPGTVDSDYRGEVCVLLVNLSPHEYTVHIGDRIAQLVIARCEADSLEFTLVDKIADTGRSQGGFGSTGR